MKALMVGAGGKSRKQSREALVLTLLCAACLIFAVVEGFSVRTIHPEKSRLAVRVGAGDDDHPPSNCRDSTKDGGSGATTPSAIPSQSTTAIANRRKALTKLFATPSIVSLVSSLPGGTASAITRTGVRDDDEFAPIVGDGVVTVPIRFIPSLNAYVVQYYLFGERFGGIVDTGSPFLTVPATCSTWSYKYLNGCYRPEFTWDSGYTNTVEGFDNMQGRARVLSQRAL